MSKLKTVRLYSRSGFRLRYLGKYTVQRDLSPEEHLAAYAWGLRESADYLEIKGLLEGLGGFEDAVSPTATKE